ncbi:MAG: glutathione S-transferase family protein [Nevskia sp.]|nr:glutathione S-transferase family protein [Nevskia sp.]
MTDTLLATRGAGSMLIEAGYALAGVPLHVEYVDYTQPGPGLDHLRALNPLGQVPTLQRANGTVMTESAAILLQLAEAHPHAGLAPALGDSQRADFLRWLFFLVSAVYPTFTYGDEPQRWVLDEISARQLRRSTDQRRAEAWQQLERSLDPAPWLLGERFSLLDVYIGVMTRWRPRRAWFAERCPKLYAVALGVDARPELAEVWRRNFD